MLTVDTFSSSSSSSSNESRQMLIIYGGWDGAGTIFNDCLCLHLREQKQWDTTKLVMSSSSSKLVHNCNSCRFGHASDLFENGTKVILFGGVNASDDLQDLLVVHGQK